MDVNARPVLLQWAIAGLGPDRRIQGPGLRAGGEKWVVGTELTHRVLGRVDDVWNENGLERLAESEGPFLARDRP